ncbi:MAG: hypothetical protein LBM92_02930, partial [Opitutaceae bacterium]|nr:hypothetical protein [Opitutaceae bacterium]
MSKQRADRKRGKTGNATASAPAVVSGAAKPVAPPAPDALPAPPAAPSIRGRGCGRWCVFFAAALVVAVCLAWANSLRAPFVLDDHESIVTNASIRDFWSLRWLSPPSKMGETVSGRPVLNFTFAVNYALGGLDARGWHL